MLGACSRFIDCHAPRARTQIHGTTTLIVTPVDRTRYGYNQQCSNGTDGYTNAVTYVAENN